MDTSLNVYQNIAQGLRTIGIRDEEIIFQRVMTALDNVGLREYFKRNVESLSGGQQQRVAIARAMVKGAKIVLADEPTGNLDEENTKLVMDILKEMSKSCLVVLVTHEPDIIDKYADIIIEIKDGRVLSQYDGDNSVYHGVDKNNIYLGDMQKSSLDVGDVHIQVWGESSPVNIRLVYDKDKIYLSADSNVRLVSKDDELRLVDQTKEEYYRKVKQERSLDLKKLGYVQPQNTGKVFCFGESLKAGFENVFGGKKKKLSAITITLILMSLAIVILTMEFGSAYARFSEVYTPPVQESVCLEPTIKDISPIVELGKQYGLKGYVGNDRWGKANIEINFSPFESLGAGSGALEVNMCMFSMMQQDKVLYKNFDNTINASEVVLTSIVAKKLVEQIEYTARIEDLSIEVLLGELISVNDIFYKIAGIVEEDYKGIYMNDTSLLCQSMGSNCRLAENYGLNVPEGSVVYVKENAMDWPLSVYDFYGKSFDVIPADINGFIMAPNISKTDYALNTSFAEIIAEINRLIPRTYYFNTKDIESLRNRYLKDIPNKCDITFFATNAVEFQSAIAKEYNDVAFTEKELPDYTFVRQNALLTMTVSGISILIIVILLLAGASLLQYAILSARIKEIGVYRAVGIGKNNILFKFFAESLALVVVAVVSVFLLVGLPLVLFTQLQWWLWSSALLLISLGIVGASLLPVAIFLSETPIRILSRYDI